MQKPNTPFRLLTLACFALFSLNTLMAQVVFRYGPNIDGGWGDANMVVTPYVCFPASFTAPYQGCQVTTVRIGLAADATNVYLYIKKSARDSQPIYKQKLGDLPAGWNDIVLDQAYDITGEDIAIGYKANFKKAEGVGCSLEHFSDGDIIYYNSKNSWTSSGGSVCIQALVEGELPLNEMLMGSISGKAPDYETTETTYTGTVRNVGGNDISAYTLCYQTDNDEAETIAFEREVAVNQTDTFQITVPTTIPGTHHLRVWISEVNGQSDAYAQNNEAQTDFFVKNPIFKRRVVCEEYTGLWCGWCPRGMVGMELMLEKYPDRFIPISIHGGDVLEIDASADYSYQEFINSMTGAPSCKVDRRMGGDPFLDIQRLFDTETTGDAPIAYEMTATWNADSTAIQLHSEFFAANDMEADYHIAYVLTEDSITGYEQTNYYSDGRNGEFYGWETKGEHTSDVYFNDLARGIFGGFSGMECFTGTMVANEVYTNDYELTLPTTVVDKRQLHVVGLIIDNRTGYIANGFRTTPEEAQLAPTAITHHPSPITQHSSSSTQIYNLQGRLVNRGYEGTEVRWDENSNLAPSHPRTFAPPMKKGIYIVKTPTSGTKKIILK